MDIMNRPFCKCSSIEVEYEQAHHQGKEPPDFNYEHLTIAQHNYLYNPKRIKNAIISEKSPIASDNANPRIAYENNCGFKEGFRAYPMIKLPNTVPIPAPEPDTPTVAAPAPINLAACSISRLATDV